VGVFFGGIRRLNSGGIAVGNPVLAGEAVCMIVERQFQYIIINLGMSENFGLVDLEHLPFPVHMRVDYVRVYQPKGEENIDCDPPDFPTQAYINRYVDAYTNPGLTTLVDGYNQTVPR
jgi:hypothetical protein